MKYSTLELCLLALATSSASIEAFAPISIRHAPLAVGISHKASFSDPFAISKKEKSTYKSNDSFQLRMSAGTNAVGVEGSEGEPLGNGSASLSSMIFSLAKNIVGAGVLSLPAGIAAFGNKPSAMLPATLLIAAVGGLSGYAFSLIGRVCSYTGALSYRDAWSKTIGEDTSIIPAASCTFKTSCAILAYSMILADTGKSLLSTVGLNLSRTNTLFGITGAFLLPLCLLKNLAALAPFSLLGVVGMGYTTLAMLIRYFAGAYKAPSGALLPDVAASLQPSFGTNGAMSVFSPNSFILISMLSTAYMAHFNAPKFFVELKDNTIKRYNILVGSAFALSIAIFIAIAGAGFLTFGGASSGLILNNYSNKDVLMSLSRVAVAISLVFSYPLVFSGCRDGVLDLANVPAEKRTNGLLNKVTVGILAAVTGLALVLDDLSFVLSFGGATLGNALIYVYPALMFRKAVKNMGDKATKGLKREVNFALSSAGLGVGMGILGAKMALKSLTT